MGLDGPGFFFFRFSRYYRRRVKGCAVVPINTTRAARRTTIDGKSLEIVPEHECLIAFCAVVNDGRLFGVDGQNVWVGILPGNRFPASVYTY